MFRKADLGLLLQTCPQQGQQRSHLGWWSSVRILPGGFVGNEQQLATALQPVIQKAALQYQRRNTGNGLVLAGR